MAWVVLWTATMASSACAACGGSRTIRDWGLHRQWSVRQDSDHPARPARLVEIPWGEAEARGCADPNVRPPTGAAVVVKAGERIRVVERAADAVTELQGQALEAGRAGEVIRVRAGLRGAILRGRVLATGVVQLEPEKGR